MVKNIYYGSIRLEIVSRPPLSQLRNINICARETKWSNYARTNLSIAQQHPDNSKRKAALEKPLTFAIPTSLGCFIDKKGVKLRIARG
jgi:hypothetical protein